MSIVGEYNVHYYNYGRRIKQHDIHFYVKFMIHSELQLHKWGLDQCHFACSLCKYNLFSRLYFYVL